MSGISRLARAAATAAGSTVGSAIGTAAAAPKAEKKAPKSPKGYGKPGRNARKITSR